MAPQVTIPPPPMPANRPRQGDAASASVGSGRPTASSASRAAHRAAGSLPLACGASDFVVTKLGQNPLRQDRSVLQLVGLMRRLRPCSVSTGSMAMQCDCAVQSPQFSQTRSLITTRVSAADQLAALAAPALLGGADLVVDDRADAGVLAHPPLHRVEVIAPVAQRARRQCGSGGKPGRVISHHGDQADALRGQLLGDLEHRRPALRRLAAGHRHGVVEQDLVGDRRSGPRRLGGSPAGRSAGRCRPPCWRTCAARR